MRGFILIAYESPAQIVYDLLFLHGAQIVECGRMSPDLRVRSAVPEARERFNLARSGSQVQVFLYEAHLTSLGPFLKTFSIEPCLKVPIETLSMKQISVLLRSTGCRNGILERNEFTAIPPRLEFRTIDPATDPTVFPFSSKRGRLLVYDIDKNRDLLSGAVPPAVELAHSVSSDVRQPPPEPNPGPSPEVAEFIRLINRPEFKPGGEDDSDYHEARQADRPRVYIKRMKLSPDEKVARKSTSAKAVVESPTVQDSAPPTSQAARSPLLPIAAQHPLGTPEDAGEYTRLFDRLYRSFRQKVLELFGTRSDDLLARGEQQAKFLSPDFDLHSLTVETAPAVLHLIEAVIREAPLLKRPRLRESMLILIGEVYDKYYDLLERFDSLEAVEKFYYTLKK